MSRRLDRVNELLRREIGTVIQKDYEWTNRLVTVSEVEEVRTNFECGIRLGEFNEYEEGDIIECYKLEKYAQTL